MEKIFLSTLCIWAVFGTISSQQQGRKKDPVPEITQKCLDCICQMKQAVPNRNRKFFKASSGCDLTVRCHNAGPTAYFCGPFVISWAYWSDAGKPGNRGRAHDFETCLNNKTCAELAVKGYMKKNGRDCDKDGSISCHDFTRIHKLGPGSCDSDNIEDTEYWTKFLQCYDGNIPAGNDDYDSYDYSSGIDARKKLPGK